MKTTAKVAIALIAFVAILGAIMLVLGPQALTSTSSTPATASSLNSAESTTISSASARPSYCHSNGGLPDPKCTPGATNPDVTQANIQSTICVSGYTASIRPPESYTNPLKVQSIHDYGYGDTNLSDFEEDHLIPLEIGGSPTSVSNLWAEPNYGTYTWAMKDGFENYLNSQVCSGQMTLAEAQHEIAMNWVQYWLASKGVSTTSLSTTFTSTTTTTTSSSSTTAAAGQITAIISFGGDPVARGRTQTITVTASDQNGPLQNVAISIHVVYASQQTTKDFLCTTSSSGTCSVSWLIGGTSNPGTFTVAVIIDNMTFNSSFQVTTV